MKNTAQEIDACKVKHIQDLLADHTPGNGMLYGFLTGAMQGLANLAILKTYLCDIKENEILDQAMRNFGYIAEWLQNLEYELNGEI